MIEFHFDCVFYYVTEMERSLTFYKNVLGLKLTSRDVVVRFDIDGVLFELVPGRGGEKLDGTGNARLCLRVDNIKQAVEYLRTKGIHASEILKVENGRLATFDDPDGNELCLWQCD